MTTVNRYIALLRAINVGGRGVLPMTTLQQVFRRCGAEHISTLLHSGNVVFSCSARRLQSLRRRVSDELATILRTRPTIYLRTAHQVKLLASALASQAPPLSGDTKGYVCFYDQRPARPKRLPLVCSAQGLSLLRVRRHDAWVLSRRKRNGGFGFPNALVEDTLAVEATARNWNTIRRLDQAVRDGS